MPYGSARDLPTFVELDQQLKGARLLRFMVPRKDRHLLDDIPAQLDHIAGTVDGFYDLLGPRNWIFHNDLSVTDMAALVSKHANDPDSAETAFIAWYQSDDRLASLVTRLHGHEALRARMDLLRLAQEDYRAGRYYAVVQVVISVMDGFVNDLNPANRKGLHARDSEEMDAWNSVVGHHMGLTSAHKSFTKTFKARSDEPVNELYRNGIVHGMLTNYNNAIVATKAWNRLFAVADWARSLEAEQQDAEKPPNPTWRELVTQLKANAETKAALDAFTPQALTVGDPALITHPVYVATIELLRAWQADNYGAMAGVITHMFRPISPKDVRNEYQGHRLEEHEVLSLDHSGAAVCIARLRLHIDGSVHTPELRWIREGPDGRAAAPNEAGDWRLMWWGFDFMTRGIAV